MEGSADPALAGRKSPGEPFGRFPWRSFGSFPIAGKGTPRGERPLTGSEASSIRGPRQRDPNDQVKGKNRMVKPSPLT